MGKMKMKYRLLSNVCEYRNERISAEKVNENNYISTENMLPNRGGIEAAVSVADAKTFPAYKEGDILLSNIRPYFKKIWFADRIGGCSNDVLVLKVNKSVDKKFLYYVLSDNNFFNYSTVTSKGTKMPRGSKHAIMKYLVPDIDKNMQVRIADILATYDDLIDNNNHRIALLEQTAQELYNEWFVRFRFPSYENAIFENGLPMGWSYGKFTDQLYYVTGKLDSNAAVEDGMYSFYTCAKTVYKTDTYCFDGECVLLGGNNATGDFSLFYANEKLDAYQRTYIVTPKNTILSCAYIYFVLKKYLLQFKTASIGATTKFLTKGMLDKVKILVPNESTMNRFNNIAHSMFNEIILLHNKNENLAKQRDLLLPRLMSGKLEV